MRKYAVLTEIKFKPVKRSFTMEQIETLFILAINHQIEKHRAYFNITFTIPGQEQYNKAVTVKKIPNGYLKKFDV